MLYDGLFLLPEVCPACELQVFSVVITDADDLKFDAFGGSAIGGLSGYDWPDKDDQVRRPSGGAPGALPSSVVLHRKETSFGSSENVTHTTVAKVTTFPIDDTSSSLEAGFAPFADFSAAEPVAREDDDDFGDFASTVSEKSDSPTGKAETGPDGSEEFGAFQGDKPKFGKSDFLKASAQPKVKSSEEMIKNELATFDLSVQGEKLHSESGQFLDKQRPHSQGRRYRFTGLYVQSDQCPVGGRATFKGISTSYHVMKWFSSKQDCSV